jgi:hypothetical protein
MYTLRASAKSSTLRSRYLSMMGCLAVVSFAVPALGQSPPAASATFNPEIDAKCPEAVTEAAQIRARWPARTGSWTVTRPALRANLLLMQKQDQEVRESLRRLGGDPATDPGLARMREIDTANLKRLKHIIEQDGLPTAQMVGLDGVGAAWLIAVHAGGDPDFQEKVLKLAREHVKRGEVRADQVALLTDDWLSGRGKPQRYGTNFVISDGELKPAPMEDEANVDSLRRSVGLGTLANYACVIRAAYGPRTPQPPAEQPR